MGLETGTYFADLNASNPTGGDLRSQLDDHIRLMKAAGIATCPIAAPVYPLTSATAQDTTSGTAVSFTSIPSWVKRITVSFAGVSTSGTNSLLVTIGDSGGLETTGYLGSSSAAGNASTPAVVNFTNGFGISSGSAANVVHGQLVLTLLSSSANTWVASGSFSTSNTAAFIITSGSKSLSATLDRLQITTVGGVDTFDAGAVNVLYE